MPLTKDSINIKLISNLKYKKISVITSGNLEKLSYRLGSKRRVLIPWSSLNI